jgi:hypothetical protein
MPLLSPHVQDVQARLATATSERSEYRQYLLEAQAELQQTRSELVAWSDGLVELNTVMGGLDDDLTALFGEGPYQEAVGAAMSLTNAIGGGAPLLLSALARILVIQALFRLSLLS